jgi:hypothetical protein
MIGRKELEKARLAILKEWQKMLFGENFNPAIEVAEYLEDCTSRIVRKVIDIYSGKGHGGVEEAIDDLMRYLATDKNLTPGQAVSTIINLKNIIHGMFPQMELDEFLRLDTIIDNLACLAFDSYSALREEIFELRLEEKDKEKRMLERSIELALENQEFYDNIIIK